MKWPFRMRWRWEMALLACMAVGVAILLASELGHMRLQRGYDQALREMRESARMGELLASLADAEAAQRGFLLTRRDAYLDSYHLALPRAARLAGELNEFYRRLDDPAGQREFSALLSLIGEKTSEMELTIGLVREGRPATAQEITRSNIGKEKMDLIRQRVAFLQQRERERTTALIGTWEFNRNLSRFSVAFVTVLNIVLLAALFRALRRDWGEQKRTQNNLMEEQERLDRLVRQRTMQLEALATHIQQVSENEKSALARELHDELGAILTAAKMDIAWVRQRLDASSGELPAKLARAIKNLDQGVQLKRRIIENLRPTTLTAFGLVVALRDLAEQAAERNGWQLALELPEDDWALPEDASIALFRIAQETLNNAAKYARARNVSIRLWRAESQVRLSLEDDGCGFLPSQTRPKSHGLAGMRQRMMGLSGTLEVSSELGVGTIVHAALPVAAAREEARTAAEAQVA